MSKHNFSWKHARNLNKMSYRITCRGAIQESSKPQGAQPEISSKLMPIHNSLRSCGALNSDSRELTVLDSQLADETM
jgi:hypothetical protein